MDRIEALQAKRRELLANGDLEGAEECAQDILILEHGQSLRAQAETLRRSGDNQKADELEAQATEYESIIGEIAENESSTAEAA